MQVNLVPPITDPYCGTAQPQAYHRGLSRLEYFGWGIVLLIGAVTGYAVGGGFLYHSVTGGAILLLLVTIEPFMSLGCKFSDGCGDRSNEFIRLVSVVTISFVWSAQSRINSGLPRLLPEVYASVSLPVFLPILDGRWFR